MGKKERLIKAKIAEYYKETNQFGYQDIKLTADDMKSIDEPTPEEKETDKILNVVRLTKKLLLKYVDDNLLDLCEYLDDENIENFVRYSKHSLTLRNPSSRLITVTEKPPKPVIHNWPKPYRELSIKNKKRFGTWENFNKYWEEYYRKESNKKSDAITIILRSIIIPWVLRIKLDWPNRMETKRKELELREKEIIRQKHEKWKKDDEMTELIAIQNAEKANKIREK